MWGLSRNIKKTLSVTLSNLNLWYRNLILWHSLMRKLQNNLTERGSNTHFNILIASSNFCSTQLNKSLMNDTPMWQKWNKLFYNWTKSQRKVHFVYWISHQPKDLFQSQFSDVNLVNKIASDCIYLMDFQMHFKWSFTSRIFILICEKSFPWKDVFCWRVSISFLISSPSIMLRLIIASNELSDVWCAKSGNILLISSDLALMVYVIMS